MLLAQHERRIPLSLLCVLGLTFLIGCTSKPNRFGIIFVLDNEVAGTSDIYRIPDNTKNKLERLTYTPNVGEYHLLVSKNGGKIIFEAGPSDNNSLPEASELAIEDFRHVYLLDASSKKLVDITNGLVKYAMVGDWFTMDWSPDQKQFAATNGEGLELMNFDGTNKRDIPIPSLGENPNIMGIEWSPDGKKLALFIGYVPESPQHHGIAMLIYDLGSGKPIQLTDYQEGCYIAKWSPNSQQVAATCGITFPYTDMVGPDTLRIFSIENPGQPSEHLAVSTCRDPLWSPDGKQLAFECDKGNNQEGLFIINFDGSGLHEVKFGNLASPAFLRYPIWSPDGTQIVFVAGTDYKHTNIYSVHTDGSNNHAITSQSANYQVVSVYPVP